MVQGGGRLHVRWDGLNRSTRVTNPSNEFIERNSGNSSSSSTSGGSEFDFDLNPNAQPWDNFDLSVWGLDSPALRDTSASEGSRDFERGVRIDIFEFIALNEGSSNSDFEEGSDLFFGNEDNLESSSLYFFTSPKSGMAFNLL